MKLTTLKSRIPSLHKPSGGWADQRRGSSNQRGYGAQWQKQRRQVLQQQGGICQPCLRRGHVTPGCNEVDHIINKAQGGDDSPENLQTICTTCHKAKTASEARGLVWDEVVPDR